MPLGSFGRETARPVLMTKNLSMGRMGFQATQEEAVALAHAHGFESVDPDASYLGGLNNDELALFLKDLESKGLVWAAAGVPIQFHTTEADFLRGMKGLPEVARTLQRAGVTRAATWLMFGSNDLTYRQYGYRMASRLRAIAEVLGEHDIRLGLEYIGTWSLWSTLRYPWVHTMAGAQELIADIGLSNVGLVLDSWHWHHAEEGVDEILALRNEDIVAVDLNDAPKGVSLKDMQDNAREIPCATGVIDGAGFLRALQTVGYDGPVRAEPFNAPLQAMSKDKAVATIAESFKVGWSYFE